MGLTKKFVAWRHPGPDPGSHHTNAESEMLNQVQHDNTYWSAPYSSKLQRFMIVI